MIKILKLISVLSFVGFFMGFVYQSKELIVGSIIVALVSQFLRWLLNDHVR